MKRPFRYVRTCAWGGVGFIFLSFLFWGLLGRNIPPYSAALSAEDLAAAIRAHQYSIRIGMIGEMVISPMAVCWGLAITKVMERVEQDNDVLSTLQMWGASISAAVVMFSCAFWLGLAYRADTLAPDTLRVLFDTGWMMFDITYGFVILQVVPLAICFLNDARPEPLVPRWFCWYCLWFTLSTFLVSLMPFFYDGVFARNGLINFWYEFPLFGFLFVSSTFLMLRAIERLEAEDATSILHA